MGLARALLSTVRRAAPRISPARWSPAAVPRRMLNTETAPSLFAAHVTARNGHVVGDHLDLRLGKGKTNPEELFAACYGACFQGAMNVVAPALGVKMPSKPEDAAVVHTTVHLVGYPKDRDWGLRVHLKVEAKGLRQDDLEKVIARAKTVCPFARATEGNVHTTVEAVAL